MALKCQEISIKVYEGFTLEEFCKLSKIQRNWLSFSLRKQPFLLAQPSGDERRARRNGCFRKLTFLFVGLWKTLKYFSLISFDLLKNGRIQDNEN